MVCFCFLGWTGRSCADYDCTGVGNCYGNGECIGPNICKCHEGWSGTLCIEASCMWVVRPFSLIIYKTICEKSFYWKTGTTICFKLLVISFITKSWTSEIRHFLQLFQHVVLETLLSVESSCFFLFLMMGTMKIVLFHLPLVSFFSLYTSSHLVTHYFSMVGQ